MSKHQEMRKEAIQDIIECLESGYSGNYADLHNEVFNTDYYIIGTYRAKEALREYDVSDAIEKVLEYEDDMFGEHYTDVSDPEKLVNMLYYVIGDEIIGEMSDIMYDNRVWGESGNPETNEWIIQQMKELFKDELEEV